MGSTMFAPDDTRSRSSVGTVNFAASMTVPAVHRLPRPHRRIAEAAAPAGLAELLGGACARFKGIEILTPDDPARYGAVTSFRLPRMRDYAAAQRMARLLLEKHRILTVARRGIDQGAVVRVTPTLYNTTAELDRLVAALRLESGAFV